MVHGLSGRPVSFASKFVLPADSVVRIFDLVHALERDLLQAAAAGATEAQLAARLTERGASSSLAALVGSVYTARLGEIAEAARERVTTLAGGKLRDFDWSLRLVLSGDKGAALQEPVLLLSLDTEREGERVVRTVELNVADLDALLADLGRIVPILDRLEAAAP